MGTTKKSAPRSLAHGRPPTVRKLRSISRKATRTLINSHHVLEKRKAQAQAEGRQADVATIEQEIASLGGLERYQQASLQGQRKDRGGDSSKVLMEWLQPSMAGPTTSMKGATHMLEVGALSTSNACSQSGLFDIERIDLNSQADGILQQDFMERPLPSGDGERFDIISLSLVLNFVPTATERGNMLVRTLDFLRAPTGHADQDPKGMFPSLFLVLPGPCVTNSRYMDEDHLEAIMNALGYDKMRSKLTQKLVYYLWVRKRAMRPATFTKSQLRTGGARNNFSVVIHNSSIGA